MAREVRRTTWKEISLAAASAILALVLLDRALCFVYPAFEIGGSMLVADAELGWKLRPNHVIPSRGLRTNAAGFRGDRFQTGSPWKSVAFVGDSVTFGATSDSNTFPALFQEITGWQSLNFGVPRYGPLEYEKLIVAALEYDPELLVVGFFVGNDVTDCREGRSGRLDEVDGRRSFWAWSGIYRFLLFRGVITWDPMEEAIEAAAGSDFDRRSPHRTGDEFTRMELTRVQVFDADALRSNWACVESAIHRIAETTPDAILLILPDQLQVDEVLWETIMGKAADRTVFDREYPNRRLTAIASAAGLRVLDVTASLRRVREPTYFRWDSHPNPLGNRVIASFLARELRVDPSMDTPADRVPSGG